ncbi:MAG: hypothetical protein EP326_10965 [Deltaproteobacteria bacterium]|nr:MAG: hypothetical protein EP326_10965 [Deltaproteobacteria bacterium]TNF26860.1 MAG: hypothetical protein EP319_12840 [Deltaproteobacteria bacterium]
MKEMLASLTNIKKNELVMFILVFLVAIVGMVLSYTNKQFYEHVYVTEDGWIEYLTFLALLLGSILCWHRANILKPFRGKFFAFCLTMMGFLFLFGALEEISYAQRLIGFETPEWFKIHNTQGEFNFHNLKFGDFKVNRYIFGTFLGILVVLYFLVMPFLYVKLEKVKNLVDKFAIPVPKLFHIAAYILLAIIVKFIDSSRKGEILEFGGCWIFLLMCFGPLNRQLFSRKSFER